MDRHPLRRIGFNELPNPQLRLFSPEVDETAAQAILEVRERGEAGLRAWAEKLGELSPAEPLLAGREELEAAYARVGAEVKALLARAQSRIAAFAAAQRSSLSDIDIPVPGGRAGQVFLPVARAGCYVPGGRYPLPSTALMTVTPAIAAGVREVWCAGPHPTDITLAAAFVAGATGFLRCGGAHAIAAPRLRRGPSSLRCGGRPRRPLCGERETTAFRGRWHGSPRRSFRASRYG